MFLFTVVWLFKGQVRVVFFVVETFINNAKLVLVRRTYMVKAMVEIDENTNRVLNVVKAKYGLQDKAGAIEFVVSKYIEFEDEPELRQDFIAKIHEIEKQKSVVVKDFLARYKR